MIYYMIHIPTCRCSSVVEHTTHNRAVRSSTLRTGILLQRHPPMKSRFVQEMQRFISKQNMIEDSETVLVAVSGGADSLALLYALYELRKHINCHLHVVHLNHSLRDNSSEDTDFVHKHATRLDLPFTGHTVDVSQLAEEWKLSIETAGRKARYEFFDSVCADVDATKVALGHQQDDITETVLMNLIRGGGTDALKGIPPIRSDKYIRPLTIFTRQEIQAYLKSINLIPQEDPTNTDSRHLRNRIRHELLPLLERDYNPNIRIGLNRTTVIISSESDYLDELTREAFKHCLLDESKPSSITLSRRTFLHYHIAIQRRIIRQTVLEVNGSMQHFSFEHYNSIFDIILGDKPNTKITLPNGIQVRRVYQNLFFERETIQHENYEYTLNVPGRTTVAQLNTRIITKIYEFPDNESPTIPHGIFEAMLDFSKIKLPIQIRNRREGDRIQPHGMQGTKKIKDYFMDLKVPQCERDRIPLIVCSDEILWVIGFTTNDKYKVRPETRKCLHFHYGKIDNIS